MQYRDISGALKRAALLGAILVTAIPCAYGLYGEDLVATAGQDVPAPLPRVVTTVSEDGTLTTTRTEPWPDGVLDLVNDPLRTNVRRHWFSECPNDIQWFEFAVRSTADINHLIERLAAIKADCVRLELAVNEKPTREESPGATTLRANFAVGDQCMLDSWFENLPCDDTGAAVFGVNRYTEPPKACPPTLALMVGPDAADDLAQLRIPARVQVTARVPEWYRAEHEGSPTIKLIDQFVAAHAGPKNTDTSDPADKP